MTKFFVDNAGNYIGGFDGANPPDGATEVPTAPEDARQTWECMTKFFVDNAGKYLGGFEGAEPPDGATEVPTAPEDARQTWDGARWSDRGALPKSLREQAMDRLKARPVGAVTRAEFNDLLDVLGL